MLDGFGKLIIFYFKNNNDFENEDNIRFLIRKKLSAQIHMQTQ